MNGRAIISVILIGKHEEFLKFFSIIFLNFSPALVQNFLFIQSNPKKIFISLVDLEKETQEGQLKFFL